MADQDARLRASEERLARAQRIAGLGSWELEPASGRLTWSRETYRIFGLEPEAFAPTYDGFFAAVHPEDRARMQDAQDAALAGRASLDIEHRIVRSDGAVRWVHELGELRRDDEGHAVGLVGTVLDITERRLAADRLARQVRRYRVLSQVNAAIAQAGDAHALHQEVVRIVVESAGLPLAAIVDLAEGTPPQVQAAAGRARGYLEGLAKPRLQEPAATDDAFHQALHTAQPVIHDARAGLPDPWLAAHGLSAEAAFPIIAQGTAQGALLLGAADPSAFDPDEVALFSTVADALALSRAALSREEERRRAQQELAATRRRVELVLDSIGEGIHGLDRHGRIVFENRAARTVFGWSEAELIGQPGHDLVHHHRADGSVFPHAECPIHKTLEDGLTRHVDDDRFFRRDGTSFPVQYTCAPITDEGGAVVGAVVSFRDVTEREQHARELRARDELLQRTFAGAATGLAVTDLEGRFLITNAAYERMLGYTHDELRQTRFSALTHPDEREDNLALVRSLLAGERESFIVEKRYLRKDGEPIWSRVSVSMARDGEGEPTALIAVAEDIDAQRKAADSLQMATSLLRLAGRVARIGGWSVALPDFAVTWSDEVCAIHDEPPGTQPDSDRAFAYYPPADCERLAKHFERCMTEGTAFDIQCQLRTARGRLIDVRVIAEAIRDASGRITAVQGALQDITERVAAERETLRLEAETNALARRLKTTLESITDAFFTVDRQWRFTFVNPRAEAVLGRPRDELLGQNGFTLFPESIGTRFEHEYRAAMEGQTTVHFEEYYAPFDKWLDVTIYPSSEGLAVHLRDVSAEHANREALRLSDERFRLLSRATNDVVWDWDLASGRMWWNEAYQSTFGYSGQAGEDFAASWIEHVHADDRERVVARVEAAIASGQTVWSDEYRYLHADGRVLHVADRGFILRDAQERPQRMIGSMTDVTERKRSEERLAEQAALLDRAQDAILVRDLDDRIRYWNKSAERMYGWAADEVLGQPIARVLYGDPAPFREATRQVYATGEWTGEIEQITKDGKPVTVVGRWSLVRAPDGAPRSILAINTDVTEKKRLEQQFLRAQRLESIGTLAGGVAHDLNNVLAPILMAVSVLADDERDPERREDLATIAQCAERGADLVRQLLVFARGSDGQKGRVDVAEIVAEVHRMMRDTFPKNVAIRLDVGDDDWEIDADATHVHQMLTNLCVNARDAMPDGGLLTIGLARVSLDETYAEMHIDARPGPYVLLRVEDTGTGMTPETIERIFEPFFTTKEVGKGTGLGLSTVHAIVRGHQGFINVHSEPGEGTRFRVYLPATTPSVAAAGVHDGASDAPRGRGELVLVVDDEETIRHVAARTLERFGYRVVLAANGAEAVAIFALRGQEIDLVLTDMAMPVMDGAATMTALRALDPTVRIVASSGLDAGGGAMKMLDAGARHFIAKPYSADELLRVLRRALDERT